MQLVGNPEKGSHFFTIWSPRQCGKTWLLRQAADRIAQEYPERFTIAMMSNAGRDHGTGGRRDGPVSAIGQVGAGSLRPFRSTPGNLGLPTITLALFAPLGDETIPAKLSGTHDQDGVMLHVVAIGWV